MAIFWKVSGAALLVGVFGFLGACKEEVNVNVECVTTAAPAVECTVKQTKGKSEVETCWDFSVTCGNGEVVKAQRTCHKIKDGATDKVTIGADKLSNVEKCAGSAAPAAKLENLTINGKASK